MEKDANGQIVKDKEGKVINKHPVVINPELPNRGDILKKLEQMVVSVYNEFKGNPAGFNKEVEANEIEQGDLNVTNTWVVGNKDKNGEEIKKSETHPLKSTNAVLIGAFRVNEVNLIYNTAKNDFNFIVPSYESKNAEGQTERKGFLIPKTTEAYSKLKNKLQTKYKEKVNEIKENAKNKNLEQNINNLSNAPKQVANTQNNTLHQ